MSHSPLASACVAAFTALAIAGSAAADPPRPFGALSVETTTVRLSDVDLHTVKGAKTAALRIRNAAAFVCSGGNDIVYQIADDYMPCREHAIDRALANMQAPLVSAALGRQTPMGVAAR